jgi:hypothetical protein
MAQEPPRNNNRAWFKDLDRDTSERARKDDGGLFGWTVIILLFIGIAVACWIGSFYIFGHPEKPMSHRLLSKLGKIDPPKRFELTEAPRGEFLRAGRILERYDAMDDRELARENTRLLRNYLRNYKPSDGLVPYVVGTFNILDSFELGEGDFFPSGVVAVARSKEDPRLLVEQVFCARERVIPALHRTLLTGLDIDLKRENELAAVVHVERLPDERIKLTTVSILYPSYESATADGMFTLDPPENLDVGAGLPVVDGERQKQADAKYSHFERRKLLAEAKESGRLPEEAANRLMRIEKPLAVDGGPAVPPEPVPEPAEQGAVEIRVAIPVERPTVVEEVAGGVPEASPAEADPSPMPVQPAEPVPTRRAIAATGSRDWELYKPGLMPRGRLVGVDDMPTIAEQGRPAGRIYLQGNFQVTASGGDRAVLRSARQGFGAGSTSRKVRVIVQYPAGMRAPSKGANVSKDSRTPFQIMDVRESPNGQVNVYVREVITP